MPSGKIHQAISMRRTGKTYDELHAWIDNNQDDNSVNHRSKNHYYTDELRQNVSKRFGDPEAVGEWLFHIALDNLHASITNDWIHNFAETNILIKLGFKKNKFIYYEGLEVDDDQLEDEFCE